MGKTPNHLGQLFVRTHEAGANRHPLYWYKANEIAARVLRDTGNSPQDEMMKTVVSLLALRMLDWLQPVGINEEVTEENVKATLNKVAPPEGDPAQGGFPRRHEK